MLTRTVLDGGESFEVTTLGAADTSSVVLFGVGGGGDPRRHLPLLTALAEAGCSVVAPHFERLASPRPTAAELELRARRLNSALEACAPAHSPVAGVGHSIGATMLLALAGAELWLGPGQRLELPSQARLDRLALLAPATGFFRAPGALEVLQIPVLAWAGTQDTITPPAHIELLEQSLAPVELRVVEGAGHFSFMNSPPPHTAEPLADRDGFLARLAHEVSLFVMG